MDFFLLHLIYLRNSTIKCIEDISQFNLYINIKHAFRFVYDRINVHQHALVPPIKLAIRCDTDVFISLCMGEIKSHLYISSKPSPN